MNDQPDKIMTEPEAMAGSTNQESVLYFAHAFCERVSQRFNLFAAQRGEPVASFLCDEERAAFKAACRLLASSFYCAGG